MFELKLENDLILNIINFVDKLVENTVSALENPQNNFVNYAQFKLVSTFLLTFKELLFVTIFKLKELKISNIFSHSLFVYFKSKLNFVGCSINSFINSFERTTDDHSINFKNIIKMLSDLKNDISMQK